MRSLLPPGREDADERQMYAYPDGRDTWLRANMVASVDGAASVAGSSRAMSSAADRRVLGLLRGLADCVVVGAGTARRENYTALPARQRWQAMREAAGQPPAPALVLVSRALDLDPESALFTGARDDARTVVLTAESAPAERRRALAGVADLIVAGEETVDLPRGVEELARRGYRRLLCEGGPTLLADVMENGLLDEMCLTVSPVLAGPGASRIVDGVACPAVRGMRLAHVLEEDSHLFLRYVGGD